MDLESEEEMVEADRFSYLMREWAIKRVRDRNREHGDGMPLGLEDNDLQVKDELNDMAKAIIELIDNRK